MVSEALKKKYLNYATNKILYYATWLDDIYDEIVVECSNRGVYGTDVSSTLVVKQKRAVHLILKTIRQFNKYLKGDENWDRIAKISDRSEDLIVNKHLLRKIALAKTILNEHIYIPALKILSS